MSQHRDFPEWMIVWAVFYAALCTLALLWIQTSPHSLPVPTL